MSENKVIKYFGAHYCPHSNKNSRTYDLINHLIPEKYENVQIETFWSEDINEDNKHEFLQARAEYVPTITNDKYVHLKLSLPSEFNTDNKTNVEIQEELLKNIYNQLDNEPDVVIDNFNKVLDDNNQDNNKPKGMLKQIFSYLNNDNIVKGVCILIILLVIFGPFLHGFYTEITQK